jgi:hypothetical protein
MDSTDEDIIATETGSVIEFNGSIYINANRAVQDLLDNVNEFTGTIIGRYVKDDPRVRAYVVRAQNRDASKGFSRFTEFHDLALEIFGVEVERHGRTLIARKLR